MEETTAFVGRRAAAYVPPVLTNFYPTYGDANDQVDRVTPVRRAIFQRVIPRYRLSTSETRDQGLGPAFIDAPYLLEEPGRGPATAAAGGSGRTMPEAGGGYPPPMGTPAPAPLSPGTGTLVDLFA